MEPTAILRGRCCLQEAIKQAEEGRKAPLGTLNNMLMQMRNNCNHPDLITSKFDNSPTYPPAEELVKQCGKLQLLDRLLTALKAKGHKILIFSQVGPRPSLIGSSRAVLEVCQGTTLGQRQRHDGPLVGQRKPVSTWTAAPPMPMPSMPPWLSMACSPQMTKMLDLLDTYLEQLGHSTARIDGSVKWEDRQAAIKGFNEGSDIFCFLLSTRAGGLGINLTAADTVIIYDSDWNPHQDLQVRGAACVLCAVCIHTEVSTNLQETTMAGRWPC